jgi:hypothetical protein
MGVVWPGMSILGSWPPVVRSVPDDRFQITGLYYKREPSALGLPPRTNRHSSIVALLIPSQTLLFYAQAEKKRRGPETDSKNDLPAHGQIINKTNTG